MSWLIAICVALSIAASLLVVPIVRFLSLKVGVVDQPDAERKLHRGPIALGGGLAIYLALVTAFVATIQIDRYFEFGTLGESVKPWYLLFGAAGAMLVVGLIDDAWALRGRQKLLLQFLIIAGLVGSGAVVDKVSLLGFENVPLGVFAHPITVLWLLIAVNALNLIDGADGMATTAACIICAGLGFLSYQAGHAFTPVVCFALAGALLGFLAFNRPPATIFLGDSGSMMIGLFVGVLAIWSGQKESTVYAAAPVAILAIPLFDSSAAILRRWLTGRSIYETDRAHLHHLLQEKFGPNVMLLIVAALCLTTTTLAVLSIQYGTWLSALGVAIVLAVLILSRSFGHAEARLVLGRATHFAQSFVTRPAKCGTSRQHRTVPLQGTGRWETIWEPLVEFAKSRHLAKVNIDLNLAWLHEGYHATWQVVGMPERAIQLNVRVPLFTIRGSDGTRVPIGRLEIVAAADDPAVYARISELADRLVDLQPQIDEIIAGLERVVLLRSVVVGSDDLEAETARVDQPEPIASN